MSPEPGDVDHPWWRSTAGVLADEHDAALLDLDGVVYVGPRAVEGAVAAIAALRGRGLTTAFVTNNAARPPADVAGHLRELGVPCDDTDVVTSAQAAAGLLRQRLEAGAAVLSIGAAGLSGALDAVGLRPVTTMDDAPQAVAQGFSPDTSWSMLLEACVAVRAGLPWIATNLDATLPTPRGLAPGNGALVDVVRRTTGVEPEVAGKPCRPIMDEAVARTGARRPIVIGDRLDTDIAGARTADVPSVLVLTGVSAVVDLLAAGPGLRPDYLAADLNGLLQGHRAPVAVESAWLDPASGIEARWTGPRAGDLRVTPPGDNVDVGRTLAAIRVTCAAVWERCDDGRSDVDVGLARAQLVPWTAPHGWDR